MPTIPLYVTAVGILTLIALGFAATISAVGRSFDRPHLRSWRAAWFFLALHAFSSGLALLSVRNATLAPFRPLFSITSLLAAWTHLLYLHGGMWLLCRPSRPLPGWRRWAPAVAVIVAVLLVFFPVPGGEAGRMARYTLRVTVLSVTWGAAYLATGLLILREGPALTHLARRALGGSLVLYGAARLLEPATFDLPANPVVEQFVIFGGLPFMVAVGAGMLISLLEGERRELLRAAEERAHAERVASESEAALAAALASSTEAVCIIDREHRVAAFNTPFADFVQLARGGRVAVGAALRDFTPAERWPFWRSLLDRALAGEAQALEAPIQSVEGGAPRLLAFRVTPVRRDGVVSGVLVMGRDVTEEEQLRLELVRREQRFRSLIENSSDIIFMVSPDGALQYASPSVTRVLGYEPQALLAADAFSFVHPDDGPALRDAMLRSFAGDESVPAVVPFRARAAESHGGAWVRLEAVSRPFAETDGTPRLIVSARDVRERLRLETELLAARRLETVGRLAGGVAHDFNNLLTAILGNVSLMRGGLPPSHDLRADLEEIEQSALRGAELTRRLLAFARRQMIEPRVLDLGEQVRGLERLITRLIGEDVRLALESEPGLWTVKADPTALEQALVNLAVNARDAMPMGGRLLIQCGNVRFDGAGGGGAGVPSGDWVRVEIRDTGIGIDESTLGHIFEPFFTTKGQSGGSGLGLATVFGIVSQAGGHVRVRSEVGVGTTFSLFFPRVDGAVSPDPRAVEATASVAPRAREDETILLIEDEDSVRQVTARLLRELGYQVITAIDGLQGISIAATHAGVIHAVVSDLVMPHVGGAEAVAQIRKHRPDVRVVFISGFSEDALHWRGAMPQGGRLLTKPFASPDLARAVRRALDD